jgi:carboxypeptidase family protein
MKRILSASLLILVFFALNLFGQAHTALSGTVTDPSLAVIPGATITLTNTQTGAQRQETSDPSGRYTFQQVSPGKYKVSASAAGFADVLINDVELLVNSPATMNIKFEKIGAVAEAVSVTAESVLVNASDASLGNAIGVRPITQLPFEARNVVGLLSLQPGVTYFGDPGVRDDYRSGSVSGGKADQGNVLLDGVDVNDQQYRSAFTSVLRVTLDSVEEFRTTTTNGGAEEGRTSGAQVSLITKNGTNDLHGAAYEYTRNTLTSANSFFNNASGVERQKLIRNVFGASLGGPIKKNRLFYFMNYEGRRDASDSSAVRTVPNALFRQGIFTYRKTDGTTAQLTPDQIKNEVDPLHIGPSAAVLQLLQSYPMPNNNDVGDSLNTAGYRFKSSTPLRYNTYISRIDYQADSSGKHQIFWRGNLQNDHLTPSYGIPQFPGQADSVLSLENTKGMAFGYTWVISPNLVGNLRYGFTRQGFQNTGIQTTAHVSLRDIDDPIAGSRGLTAIIPVHTISDDYSWTHGAHVIAFGGDMHFIRTQRLDFGHSFSDGSANSSWFADIGNSLVVPGVDPNSQTDYVRKMTDLLGIISEGDAQYNYGINGNALPEGTGIARTFANNEYEMYGHDTWKVTRGLTVSGGLRVSLFPALYETHGIQTSSNIQLGDWFNLRGGLAEQGKPQSLAPLLSFQLADKPGGRGLYPFQKHFSPRLGIAYSPQSTSGWRRWLFGGPGKTSIRTGFGMYYDLFGQSLIRQADATALGFSSQISNPAAASESTAPRYVNPTTIPAGLLPAAPPGGFPQVAPNAFAIATGLDSKLASPYTMNMSFTIDRELGHGFLVQGSYVGRLSRKSLQGDDVAIPTNLKDPKSGQTYFQAAAIMEALGRAGAVNVAPIPFFEDIFAGYAGGGLTATQNIYSNFYSQNVGNATTALASIDTSAFGCSPCSIFGPDALYSEQYGSLAVYRTRGTGAYHAMQWTVRKAFNNGIQFDLNYTFAKSIDMSSTRESDGPVATGNVTIQMINPWFPRQMRGVSDYDTRHLVSAFWIAELPFGHGKRFLGNAPGLVDAILGGWQITGIWRQSSGLPVSPDNGGFWATNWNIEGWGTMLHPVKQGTTKNSPTGGPNIFPDPTAGYNAFQLTFPGQSGSRNLLRGDGFFTVDVGIGKRFKMPYSEHHSIQFRAEAFNVTNTVRFDVNQTSLSLGDANAFGKYNGTLNNPRVVQFSGRYEF